MPAAAVEMGRLVAHLATLRRMSTSIAGLLAKGRVARHRGGRWSRTSAPPSSRRFPEVVRRVLPMEPRVMRNGDLYAELQQLAQQQAPSYSLRGGTREILRGMIARGLGLR